MARPINVVVRLAPVDRSYGVMAVSDEITRMFSNGSPSSSATICGIAVWLP